MPKIVPFNQRFGIGTPNPPLDKEVPESARIGLISIFEKLYRHDYLATWFVVASEALHVDRSLRREFERLPGITDEDICITIVKELRWDRFYVLCEKIYEQLQAPQQGEGTLKDAQDYYTVAINELMVEENLAYEFENGAFQRRGRPQTQKSLRRVNSVLTIERYVQVRNHFNKALKFFSDQPNPDAPNCVKEAVCALEAFVEILFGKKAAKNFEEIIRSKQGNDEGQIPPTIGESIIKLRAFRGNAKGVAHAALEGGFVSILEAELALNLVASYITYLNDKFVSKPHEEDIPF